MIPKPPSLLARFREWLAGPRPRSLPWKRVASRLRIQRDALLLQSRAQKLLLVWILNQLALERSAGLALTKLDEEAFDASRLAIPDPKRGQA